MTGVSALLTHEANTDVGKTLLTTALVRATASRYVKARAKQGKRVFYLKPVSTGPEDESDVRWARPVPTPDRCSDNQVFCRDIRSHTPTSSPQVTSSNTANPCPLI